MNINDFHILYNNVISIYIDEILDKDKEYNCLIFKKNRIDNIYIYYERKRLEIRKQHMQDPTKPLDRHKIATAIMYAILKSKVFKINKSIPNLPEELLLSNEYLAFYVGINIIEMYKRDDNQNYKDYVLFFPKTYHSNNKNGMNTFVYNTCKGLSKIKNFKHFDCIAYSTIFFLLERHTDTILSYEKDDTKEQSE